MPGEKVSENGDGHSASSALTGGSQGGKSPPVRSRDPSLQHGRLGSPSHLTDKAARLVQAGLPWPGEEELEHDARKMVVKAGVAWHRKQVCNSTDISRSIRLVLRPVQPTDVASFVAIERACIPGILWRCWGRTSAYT
jgi:hypothetical protein